MRTLKLIAAALTITLSSGCTLVPGHYGSFNSPPVYQPNADGPAATLGTSAIIPAQHIAYASNLTGAPGAFGSGVARFNAVSLEAFSLDGDMTAIPPANAQTGFFLRPTTTLSAGRFESFDELLRFSGGSGGVLSDTVYANADTLIAWGRWSDTTARLITRGNLVPLGEFFYVIGQLTPVARLPQPAQATLARYRLTGGDDGISRIQPHGRLISPGGSVSSLSTDSQLSVLWGPATPKIGLDLRWDTLIVVNTGSASVIETLPRTHQLRTNGGISDPSGSQVSLRPGTATFGGTGIPFVIDPHLRGPFVPTFGAPFTECGSLVCESAVEGFFAGPDAERAGVSFQVSAGGNALFSGAWAFALQGAPTPATVAPTTPAFVPLDPAGPFGMVRAGGPADMPASLDSLGVLTQNQATGVIDRFGQSAFTQELARGTAQSADVGGDTLITWGRWTNGSYEQVQTFGNTPIALGAEQALHYVIGAITPNANIPATGTATFSLLGGTKPTFGDGALAAGTLTGSMAVSWGGSASTKVGMNLTVTMPGDASYSIVTTGGLASPSQSQVQTLFSAQFTGTVPVTSAGRACTNNPGGCGANIAGFFAGPAAERAGIAYQLGSGNAQQSIHGAAAFTR